MMNRKYFLIPALILSIQAWGIKAKTILQQADTTQISPPVSPLLQELSQPTQWRFSAEIESRTNLFIDDDNLFTEEDRSNGSVPKQYEATEFTDQISNETWTFLRFDYGNFSFSTRYDYFRNSNLKNPLRSFDAAGVGMVNMTYTAQKYNIELGSIYHQFGKGSAFRSYEERGQQLDNALIGALWQQTLTESLSAKLIAGVPKKDPTLVGERSQFQTLMVNPAPLIGLSIEYRQGSMSHGLGLVSRRLEEAAITALQTNIDLLQDSDPFTVAEWASVINYYFGISTENSSLQLDAAFKTPEALYKYARGVRSTNLFDESGYSLGLTYNPFWDKLSAVFKARVLKNFEFRYNPNAQGNDAFVNFYAPLSRFNERRLTGRYVPNVQYQDEIGMQLDLYYKVSKNYKVILNLSDIRTSENILVYNEAQIENQFKHSRKLKTVVGLQYFKYNQLINQAEGDMVEGAVPYIDINWKPIRGHGFKGEISTMHTEEDFGSWLWANLEYQYRQFTIAAGDMYNYDNPEGRNIHYYNFYTSYKISSARMGLAFVKQPETVVCNGGVCRVEPAFNGVRFDLKINI